MKSILLSLISIAALAQTSVLGEALEQLQGAYGLGKHAQYDREKPNELQIISQLEKEGRTFEFVRVDPTKITVREVFEGPGTNSKNVFHFKTGVNIHVGALDLRLVDVWIGTSELSFVFADHAGYGYIKVLKNPLAIPAGSFFIRPAHIFSDDWSIVMHMYPNSFGYSFGGWSHFTEVEKISLKSIDNIEVTKKVGGGKDSMNISNGLFKINDVVYQGIHFPPYKLGTITEAEIIAASGQTTASDEQVIQSVEYIEGGETKFFEILNQFQNQTAATALRDRVNLAYANERQ